MAIRILLFLVIIAVIVGIVTSFIRRNRRDR